jgi:hypothetical protein
MSRASLAAVRPRTHRRLAPLWNLLSLNRLLLIAEVVTLTLAALVAYRLWAQFTGTEGGTSWAGMAYDASTVAMRPFATEDTLRTGVIDISALVALQTYLAVALGIMAAFWLFNSARFVTWLALTAARVRGPRARERTAEPDMMPAATPVATSQISAAEPSHHSAS